MAGTGDPDGEELPPLATTVTIDASRSAIAWNEFPHVGFDRSVNPYPGREHGRVDRFARPTILGLCPWLLDFETKLFAKPEAPRLLAEELSKPGYKLAVLGLGTNTDPYQPIERKMGITRGLLEVLSAFGHPVTIVTKSALVLRDLDILAGMAERGLTNVTLSVTTLDRDLARVMEPRAATPGRRLETICKLAEAGVPVGVLAAPMIPALNDAELEARPRRPRRVAPFQDAGVGVEHQPLFRFVGTMAAHTVFAEHRRHVATEIRCWLGSEYRRRRAGQENETGKCESRQGHVASLP